MSNIEFVIHCIKHHEDFPDVGEIDLYTAQTVLDNALPASGVPNMTAEQFKTAWNLFVHDPKVMSID